MKRLSILLLFLAPVFAEEATDDKMTRMFPLRSRDARTDSAPVMERIPTR